MLYWLAQLSAFYSNKEDIEFHYSYNRFPYTITSFAHAQLTALMLAGSTETIA